ncbi:MAG: DNA gyrase subunit A [Nanoarchaeota archaeon]
MTEEVQIKKVIVEDQLKEAYLDYSMSVIVGRALPDVKDGLKPVHRRILYTMHEMGLNNAKPFRKSAMIVGACFKYHPHGDAPIYESLVRMVQDFNMRYPLVHGHGNFSSVDLPTSFAHMRYTEAKLQKIAEEMLLDIEKETVDFVPNFDGSLKEPVVLPSKLPNLLLNGSTGIAVGMATNIPPHNVTEIIDGTLLILQNPSADILELMKIIKGPDFPTGAIINGRKGIEDYYKTGKGKLIVRAKTEIEDNKIIIKEIPYQVNKPLMIEAIANLVKDGTIEGIKDIRDETDKTGIRIIIHLKKDEDPKLILNQLYKHSGLQSTFGVIMLALVNNEPRILNLKEIIENYILHRKDVVVRRTKFDLNKALDKEHTLEGLKIALSNIDKVIELIKKSEDTEKAKTNLISNFKLSEKQSIAILEMRLQRLTRLETGKINQDLIETKKLILELKSILASEQKVIEIIRNELIELKNKYSDKRRTQIIEEEAETLVKEELIKEENIVVTLTYSGYIKQVPLSTYRQQRRGGKGIQGTSTKDEEDIVKNLLVTSNLNTLMFFTNKGKVYWLKGYEIPEVSRQAKGKAIVNLLHLSEGEKVNSILSLKEFSDVEYLVFATKRGGIKKTNLMEYANLRKSGIIAINLKENDEVVKVVLTDGKKELILTSKNGKAIRFNEKDAREMGRNSSGVRGIRLQDKDEVIGLEIVKDTDSILTVTEKGFGKRTKLEEYALIRRGGKGVRNIKVSEKNGHVVSTSIVKDDDEIIIISKKGQIIRLDTKQINVIGRNTSGVRVIRLNENDSVASVAKIEKE